MRWMLDAVGPHVCVRDRPIVPDHSINGLTCASYIPNTVPEKAQYILRSLLTSSSLK